ncbi:hypothetical protein Pint_08744 [Pistacia integerrima]|uniref:Uncharacterized protein n=1 Tax=Pistacia integerrima TaxID=434235 RepID=A0ACC0XX87_9ROSI|nr:hypothetical protein Pint_08744 [Pistacia integerrima]
MGDTTTNSNNDNSGKTMSLSLPPGFQFYPSDEQLLCYYLTNKNANADETGNPFGYDLIKELDLHEYQPHELPEKACYTYGDRGRRRHWYCYCKVRVRNGRKSWRAKNGYWRKKGRVREVVKSNNRGGKIILGSRTRFVFYLGDSLETAVRTNWVMHEYALVHHVKMKFVMFWPDCLIVIALNVELTTSFVLCRVFLKSHGGNSLSEIGLSSVAEESVSAVRHIGVQHDGFLTPDIVEAKEQDDNTVDRKKNTPEKEMKLVSQLDNRSRPVSLTHIQFPAGIAPNEQVGSSGFGSGGMFVDAVAAQQLRSILEEDFIELDDLVH